MPPEFWKVAMNSAHGLLIEGLGRGRNLRDEKAPEPQKELQARL